MDNYVMDNMAGAFMITQFFTAKYKSSCSQKILSEENHVAGKSYRRKIYLQEKPIAENLIAGKSYTRKYIVVGLVIFRPFFCEATEECQKKKITTAAEGAKRPGAVAGERSRMPGKSEATEELQEQKITTAAEGTKRPGAAAGERSRMPRKSEATEEFQEKKITTAAEGAKRPGAA